MAYVEIFVAHIKHPVRVVDVGIGNDVPSVPDFFATWLGCFCAASRGTAMTPRALAVELVFASLINMARGRGVGWLVAVGRGPWAVAMEVVASWTPA